MNDLWNEEEWKAISGLKRHLAHPCRKEVRSDTCEAMHHLMKYVKNDISLAELWELPECCWQEFSKLEWGKTKPIWKLELIQTFACILSQKQIDFSDRLIEFVEKYLFQLEEDKNPAYLPQPFPGHPLKESAIAGNLMSCKLHLDLSKDPEKKRQGVLQIMLNYGHFQAAADLHKMYGGGLEKIDRDLLFSIWSNTEKEKVSEDFDRIVMPLLKPRDLLLDQHPTGKWDKRMRPALETGAANGNTIIFEDGNCKMMLGKYMHFLYEIREELLKIDIGDKLKSDVHASEIFMEWENCKVFR